MRPMDVVTPIRFNPADAAPSSFLSRSQVSFCRFRSFLCRFWSLFVGFSHALIRDKSFFTMILSRKRGLRCPQKLFPRVFHRIAKFLGARRSTVAPFARFQSFSEPLSGCQRLQIPDLPPFRPKI